MKDAVMGNDIAEQCTVVAFYGVNASEKALGRTYEGLLEWFNSYSTCATQAAIKGGTFRGKMVSHSRIQRELEQKGFGDVTSVSVYAVDQSARRAMTDWSICAEVNIAADSRYCVLGIDRQLAQLCKQEWDNVLDVVETNLAPEYGIGYYRRREMGPVLYAVGLVMGDMEYDDARSINRWGDIGMVQSAWHNGCLRDVYPWNLLGEATLSRSVDGLPLRAWIKDDPNRRGQLIRRNGRLTLWELTGDQVERVRSVLLESKCLFDWREYLAKD